MYDWFLNWAVYLHCMTNTPYIYDESGENGDNIIGIVCPFCGNAIYFEDWDGYPDTENWMICPICRTGI